MKSLRRKKVLSLILTVFMVLTAFSAFASTVYEGSGPTTVRAHSPVPGQDFSDGRTFDEDSLWYKWDLSDNIGEAIKGGDSYVFSMPAPDCDPTDLFIYAKAGQLMYGTFINPGETATIPTANFQVEFAADTSETWTFTVTGIGAPHGLSNWGFLCVEPEDEGEEDGELTIVKVLEDEDGNVIEDDSYAYNFEIEQEDGDFFLDGIVVSAGGSETFDVPAGVYTVREVDLDEEIVIDSQEGNVVEAGENTTVTFINVLAGVGDELGALSISKVVTYDGDEVDDEEVFEFVILNSDGDIIKDEILVKAGETETITGLAVGTYTVREVNIDEEYYVVVENDLEAAVTLDVVAEVTFENAVVITENGNGQEPPGVGDEEGTLIISKVVTLDGEEIDDDEEFEFEILLDGEVVETVTVVGGQSVSVELPVGTYVVREVNIDSEYYEVQVNNQKAEILNNDETNVKFVNAVVVSEATDDPEEPLVGDEDDDGALPVTSGTDFILLGLGAAMATGGYVLRRRKR